MAARVTQHNIEVLRTNTATVSRVTQVAVEVMRLPTNPLKRVTQEAVEVIRLPTNVLKRVSQVVVEVMRVGLPGPRFAHVTQVGINIARNQELTRGYVSQIGIEIARNFDLTPKPALKSWMVFDPLGSIDVLMITGTPASAINELAVLNGENAVALGQEIFQFRDVTDLGNNVFRLSHLLRGRLGTEQHMNSHVANELAVFLESTTIRKIQGNLEELNMSRIWKAVGIGQSLVDVSGKAIIDTGVAIKPWAPVFIRGSRGVPLADDLLIEWTRRTRINGEWLDSVDVGLGEQIFEFKVEILTGAGSVIRTFTVIDTDIQLYLETEQSSDFGSAQDPVLVRVAQKSEQFGFGYSNTELI